MPFENLQIQHGNFTVDPRLGSSFFTMDYVNNQLIEKNSSGTVIFNYFLDRDIIEVTSLEYDGTHFWSLERQGTSGFRVRKWEIGGDDLVRMIEEFSYISDVVTPYDVNALAVEYYKDDLFGNGLLGGTTITVTDGTKVRIGDTIVIGPSTSVGYEGQKFTTFVTNKVGNTLTISPALTAEFSPNDDVFFTRNFFVFSDNSVGGLDGALYKYRASDGLIQTVQTSNMYNLVRAACFFKGVIMFVRTGEIIWLDPDSQDIDRSQAIDNLDINRSGHLPAFDLAGFSNTIYRLEQHHVFFSGGSWQAEAWSPLFNYNTSSTVPDVYFVSVKAEPPILHKAVSGLGANGQSRITVTVLDQFRTPVFNRAVSFSSTGGPLSPTSGNTDANGVIRTTYTSNTTVGQITVTATVA